MSDEREDALSEDTATLEEAAAAAAGDEPVQSSSPAPAASPIDLSRVPLESGLEHSQRLMQARRQRLGSPAPDAAFIAHNNNSKTSFYIRDILDGSKFRGRREYLDTSSPELSDTQSTGEPPPPGAERHPVNR